MATKLQDGNTCLAATPSEPRTPCWCLTPASVGCRSMTRSGISYRISITFMLSITSLSVWRKKRRRLLLSEWWQLSPRCKNVIPLRWLWSLCNTASTVSLPALREKFDFPVVGVVPAIKPAARLTANGIVGLLATRGTVKRSYTHELSARFR